MNTDETLEQLAREVTTHHPLVLTYEGRVKLTLAALHKAVEPYRKQEQERRLIHAITCVHHTDQERIHATCPVCLMKQVGELKAKLQACQNDGKMV